MACRSNQQQSLTHSTYRPNGEFLACVLTNNNHSLTLRTALMANSWRAVLTNNNHSLTLRTALMANYWRAVLTNNNHSLTLRTALMANSWRAVLTNNNHSLNSTYRPNGEFLACRSNQHQSLTQFYVPP